MPAKKHRKPIKKINLLPKDEFEASFVGRLLKWAMTIGRYIVIGTELVVIGSFLARFSFDKQVTDLNEAISAKQAVVASYGDFENEARSVQSRLNMIADLEKRQLRIQDTIEHISSFTPMDVIFSNIQISNSEIMITGAAYSEAGFRTLLNEIRNDLRIENVDIERVASKGDEGLGIEFDLKLSLKSEEQ